ncbi:MAG: Mu transposase C-terminal domain-containing protein [Anaerolineae bacterium]|nr:Mu transposase C-terminal domain-containing protein [Anaerolineae bacterium]MCO5193071.1 Mu transposase C-terminal domain-containing protein [Anaerolineae bacterium]MCO5206197.1 Mu transposase C-terminal domain-containing protein [Anaerolineae bacterium]
MKTARQVTKAANPKNHAVWTLPDMYEQFCRWSYEVYDQMLHSTLGQSPREVYLAGLNQYGLRPNRHIANDEAFRILVLPTTKRGTAKVQAGRGVKVNYLYYWCDTFRRADITGSSVAVKYDPHDAGIAYAYVNGIWERCICERYVAFQGRSEREMLLATTVLRQQLRQNRQQVDINAKLLAAFLASVEGEEAVLEQQMKDRAVRQIYGLTKGKPWPAQLSKDDNVKAQPTFDVQALELYGDLEL